MSNIEMSLTLEQARILRYTLTDSEDTELFSPEIDIILTELTEQINRSWNPEHDQQAKCTCSHAYERHFDSYEDMYPIGCKYCECDTFEVPSV
jgi:hypothetical protein